MKSGSVFPNVSYSSSKAWISRVLKSGPSVAYRVGQEIHCTGMSEGSSPPCGAASEFLASSSSSSSQIRSFGKIFLFCSYILKMWTLQSPFFLGRLLRKRRTPEARVTLPLHRDREIMHTHSFPSASNFFIRLQIPQELAASKGKAWLAVLPSGHSLCARQRYQ